MSYEYWVHCQAEPDHVLTNGNQKRHKPNYSPMTKITVIDISDFLREGLTSDSTTMQVEYGMINGKPFMFNYKIRPTLASMVKDFVDVYIYCLNYLAEYESLNK